MIGRIVNIYGPRVAIYTDGATINAIVAGKVKYADSDTSRIAVGDYVEFSAKNKKMASVDRIIARKSAITRPAVEKEGMTQVIVANIDRLVVVSSITNPDFKPGLINRFLVLAFKEKIHPVIVINKIDLANPSLYAREIAAWRDISCDVIPTSAVTGEGLEALSAILEQGTSVIAGHSGVGKSSLLNWLNPELKIKTSGISLYSGRGVHTTSRVTLFRLFPDGWVADTPGLKDLGLSGVTREKLHQYYPEFSRYEDKCQFSNCIHIDEPVCGIKMAVESGKIEVFRYDDYCKIYGTMKKSVHWE